MVPLVRLLSTGLTILIVLVATGVTLVGFGAPPPLLPGGMLRVLGAASP